MPRSYHPSASDRRASRERARGRPAMIACALIMGAIGGGFTWLAVLAALNPPPFYSAGAVDQYALTVCGVVVMAMAGLLGAVGAAWEARP